MKQDKNGFVTNQIKMKPELRKQIDAFASVYNLSITVAFVRLIELGIKTDNERRVEQGKQTIEALAAKYALYDAERKKFAVKAERRDTKKQLLDRLWANK